MAAFAYRLGLVYNQVYGNPYALRTRCTSVPPINDEAWFSSVAHLFVAGGAAMRLPRGDGLPDNITIQKSSTDATDTNTRDVGTDATSRAAPDNNAAVDNSNKEDDAGSRVDSAVPHHTHDTTSEAHALSSASPAEALPSAPIISSTHDAEDKEEQTGPPPAPTPPPQLPRCPHDSPSSAQAVLRGAHAPVPPCCMRTSCASTDTAEDAADATRQRRAAAVAQELRGYFVDPAEQQSRAPMMGHLANCLSSYEAKLEGLNELCATLAQCSPSARWDSAGCGGAQEHTVTQLAAATARDGVEKASSVVELAGCLYALRARVSLLKSRAYAAVCDARQDASTSTRAEKENEKDATGDIPAMARAAPMPSAGKVRGGALGEVTIVRTYAEEPQPYVKPPFRPARLPLARGPTRSPSTTTTATDRTIGTSSSSSFRSSSFVSSSLLTNSVRTDSVASSASEVQVARSVRDDRGRGHYSPFRRNGDRKEKYHSRRRRSSSSSSTSSFSSSSTDSVSRSSASR